MKVLKQPKKTATIKQKITELSQDISCYKASLQLRQNLEKEKNNNNNNNNNRNANITNDNNDNNTTTSNNGHTSTTTTATATSTTEAVYPLLHTSTSLYPNLLNTSTTTTITSVSSEVPQQNSDGTVVVAINHLEDLEDNLRALGDDFEKGLDLVVDRMGLGVDTPIRAIEGIEAFEVTEAKNPKNSMLTDRALKFIMERRVKEAKKNHIVEDDTLFEL